MTRSTHRVLALIAAAWPMLIPAAAPAGETSGPAGRTLPQRYRTAAERIIQAAVAHNDAWRKMEELCDGIGHRLSGSPQLQRAVEWAVETLKKDGHENVRAEKVMVPAWVRGAESLEIVKPRRHAIAMLGLGGSVGTPAEGLTAPVLCVRDEDELKAAGDKAKGRIVLFNNPMPPYDPEHGSGYGTAVRFRSRGAQLAARAGAVGCLIRSVTARSLRSPHTGAMGYADDVRKVPAAAVSIEDADMIARLLGRGEEVVVTLKMEARTETDAPSANVVGELRGREAPDEYVVIGGHLDSWDVGHGAHDDAAGCVIAMEALNVLRKLNMVPRRTIRVVLWTNEENGLRGGTQYAKDHADELRRHVAAIEADSGAFAPQGFAVQCQDPAKQAAAAARLSEVLTLLESLGATRVTPGHSGADIGPMRNAGVVLLGLDVEGSEYFDYHHSHADTLDKVDPRELSQCVAAMAVTAYVLADMPGRLDDTDVTPR